MSAESLAWTTLTGDTAVAAIVGTRIYPDFVPQEQTLPAIAVSRVSTEYLTTINTDAPVGEIAALEIWCMAETRIAAESLANAATTALSLAQFFPLDRRPEFDNESVVYAVVLSVQVLINF